MGVKGFLLTVTRRKLSTPARSRTVVTILTSVSAAVVCTSGSSSILFYIALKVLGILC